MINDYVAGFRMFFAGFSLVFKPGIRGYAVVPVLISTIVFALLSWLVFHYYGQFVDWILPDTVAGNGASWLMTAWHYVVSVFRFLLYITLIVVLVFVFSWTFSSLTGLVAGPFTSLLSEKVEGFLRTGDQRPALPLAPPARPAVIEYTQANKKQSLMGVLVQSMIRETRKLLHGLRFIIPLMVVFFIPIINIAAPFLWLLFGAWMVALEYFDIPAENRKLTLDQTRQILRDRKFFALGFGTAGSILLLIPILNLLVVPVAVIGATIAWGTLQPPTENQRR